MLSLFAGGLPDAVTAAAALVAGFGAWQFQRRKRALGGYLVFVALLPILAVMMLGASWTHQGHTFGRYVFPVQLIVLFWFSVGALELARRVVPRIAAPGELGAAAILVAAYLWLNPAIMQVRTLGPWYGHLFHHFDYVERHNRAALHYAGREVPRFYRKLEAMPAGGAPVIEAPFTFSAPYNPLAFYARFHRQPEVLGLLHDLCLQGPRYGEVARDDARFRFRSFVFLDDRAAVRATGARYLLLHRDLIHGRRFGEADRCLAALERLYGAPVEMDERLAVFELRPPGGSPKLQ